MTAFAYSTGDPTKIAGAQTAAMTDIKNSFTDIATYVNGGNLDATYMSAAVFPPRTIECRSVNVISGDLRASDASLYFVGGGTYFFPAATGTVGSFAPIGIQFDPADHAITGKTLGLRLIISTAFCDTFPASVTFGLYPASIGATSSGLFRITMGTATASLTKVPTADTISVDTVSFSAPVAGSYCFGAAAVNPYVGSPFSVTYRLEARYS